MDKTLRLIALLLFASPLWGQTILGPIREPFAAASGGGITFVQAGTACNIPTGSSGTCTVSISPNAGDNVHVIVGMYATSNLITGVAMQPGGATCNFDGDYVNVGDNTVIDYYTCTDVAASQTGPEVTCSGACYIDANALEFSGELTSSPLDVIGSGTFVFSATTYNSGSITTTHANDVVIGAFYASENWTSFTATSPWTTGFFYQDPNGAGLVAVYQIVSSATSYNPAGSGSEEDYGGLTSSYK